MSKYTCNGSMDTIVVSSVAAPAPPPLTKLPSVTSTRSTRPAMGAVTRA